MALFEGDDWYFEVAEWWGPTAEGEQYHQFDPDNPFSREIGWDELQAEADTLTGHIVWYDEDGNIVKEQYFQMESEDGWYPEELEKEVDDAVERYEQASG